MKKILTSSQMKLCDEREIERGTPSAILMERAARAVLKVIKERYNYAERILFVCGGGNNGGDGILAAIRASGEDFEGSIMFLGSEQRCTPECLRRLREARDAGIAFTDEPDFASYDLIVDAIFGIGLTREAEGRYAEVIRAINESGVTVISVDVPSGAFADSGLGEPQVKADFTVAIQAPKYANVYGGKFECAEIGIFCDDMDAPYTMEYSDILRLMGRRPKDCHKGTFGRALIIGGDVGMCGAVYLSALAAYRSGAGLVEVLTSSENRIPLQTLLPEAIVTVTDMQSPELRVLEAALGRADSVAIGMGLGMSAGAKKILSYTLENLRCPAVIDADALNLIAKHGLAVPSGAVITPHPMELSRLTGCSVSELKADLCKNARELANRFGCVVIAKNYRSVISDGETVIINSSGSPALAKGGSGDVLSGVIAALLARGIGSLDAAALGAFIHGEAGSECAKRMYLGEEGVLSREVADEVAFVIEQGKNDGSI